MSMRSTLMRLFFATFLIIGHWTAGIPSARAEFVRLDGIITEGELLVPTFVPMQGVPGGGQIMPLDQLGLTGAPIVIGLDFADAVLGDPFLDGYSFRVLDDNGAVSRSNLSVSGSFGLTSGRELNFESALTGVLEEAVIRDNRLQISAALSSMSVASNFTETDPLRLFQLMTPQLPETISTIGELVMYLQGTSAVSSGTLPLQFFVSDGNGSQRLVGSEVTFEVTAFDGELPPIPVPPAIVLFATGAFGLARFARRYRRV